MSSLDESLSRVSEALAPKKEAPPPSRGPGEFAIALGILAITLLVAAQSTGNKALLALALVLAAAGGAIFVARNARESVGKLIGEGGIGMGATVEDGAVIERGATVEMGATVARGAQIRKGARVRMGATVGPEAIIEPGAVISWGAVVERGAHVGEAAIVGAGATIERNAQVGPGMRVSPGAIWGAGSAALPEAKAEKPVVTNRGSAICDRLEQELRASPEHVRDFLGASQETLTSLRRTCEDLAQREQAMREEANVTRLDEERAALEKRFAAESDAGLKQSLTGAIAAIDELKRQRELLRVGADRL